jgi:dihydrofolate reductase
MILSIIVAFDQNRLIGKDNKLPWHLPADLKHFRSLTMGHHMIMGRKTYESIGRPLPGRTTVVITRQKDFSAPGCMIAGSLDEALPLIKNDNEVFVIGGAQIFDIAMKKCQKLYTTLIHHRFEGDTFFPVIDSGKWKQISRIDFWVDEKNPWNYSFIDYEKI